MAQQNKWSQPASPPPPLFVGRAERDFVKQINDEVIEHIIGQQLLYFPIDRDLTNYNELYGEAIHKTFLPLSGSIALLSSMVLTELRQSMVLITFTI